MEKEAKNKNNKKLSLEGSLSALTKSVQKEQEILNHEQKNSEIKEEPSNVAILRDQWNSVISGAINLKSNNRTKLETTYVYGNIKKDLERLRTIEELRNIPMAALISSIIDNFISNNSDIIKELLKNNDSRF